MSTLLLPWSESNESWGFVAARPTPGAQGMGGIASSPAGEEDEETDLNRISVSSIDFSREETSSLSSHQCLTESGLAVPPLNLVLPGNVARVEDWCALCLSRACSTCVRTQKNQTKFGEDHILVCVKDSLCEAGYAHATKATVCSPANRAGDEFVLGVVLVFSLLMAGLFAWYQIKYYIRHGWSRKSELGPRAVAGRVRDVRNVSVYTFAPEELNPIEV